MIFLRTSLLRRHRQEVRETAHADGSWSMCLLGMDDEGSTDGGISTKRLSSVGAERVARNCTASLLNIEEQVTVNSEVNRILVGT